MRKANLLTYKALENRIIAPEKAINIVNGHRLKNEVNRIIHQLNMFFLSSNGTKYSRMEQVKFFKGSPPQISLGSFLNTLTQINI